jgi:hypothetical protein
MRHGWILAIALVSCGVTHVKGPDGKTDWFKVECRREAVCMKKAEAECPKGFLLADSLEGSSTFYAKGPEGQTDDNGAKPIEMFARCGKEEEEARGTDDDEPFKPISKPKNLAGCGRNYDNFQELAAAWLDWHPSADAPDKQPNRAEFINACGDLPETVQICLSVKYGRTHQEECKDAFEELPPKVQIKLARLFEKDGEHPAKMIAQKAPAVVDLADAGSVDAGPVDAGPADAGSKKGPPPKPPKPGKAPKDAGAPAAKASDGGLDTAPSDASVD